MSITKHWKPQLGIPYFSKATRADAEERIQVVDSYIYGLNGRTIIPLVTHKEGARRDFPLGVLSAEVGTPTCFIKATN